MPKIPLVGVSGTRLRKLREKTLKMTRPQLAKKTNRSDESIRRYEADGVNGVPIEFLDLLAQLMKTSVGVIRLRLLPEVGDVLNDDELPDDSESTGRERFVPIRVISDIIEASDRSGVEVSQLMREALDMWLKTRNIMSDGFTDVVDEDQDPSEATRQRIGQRAAEAEKAKAKR